MPKMDLMGHESPAAAGRGLIEELNDVPDWRTAERDWTLKDYLEHEAEVARRFWSEKFGDISSGGQESGLEDQIMQYFIEYKDPGSILTGNELFKRKYLMRRGDLPLETLEKYYNSK